MTIAVVKRLASVLALAALLTRLGDARADDGDDGVYVDADEETSIVHIPTGDTSELRIGGYGEVYYAYNLNRPSNGITEFRAFDNRHNTLALQAAALDTAWSSRTVTARLVLQTGTAADTYYGASEPTRPGTALTPASSPDAFRFIQQAYLAWSPLPDEVTLDAGLFLSPIGAESLATHDNASWSHSLLFFGLPFYHLGARVQWKPTPEHALRVGVYNGWNNAIDNNAEKTIGVDYTYSPSDDVTFGADYFTGAERPDGAIEGRAWRHLVDLYLLFAPMDRLELLLDVDVGAEPNRLGLSGWTAGNTSARVRLTSWLYAAARATAFYERRAARAGTVADPIAIPSEWVASGTWTLEARPVSHVSLKTELRVDAAATPIYFDGRVTGDGTAASPYVPNDDDQTTVTVGVSAWF